MASTTAISNTPRSTPQSAPVEAPKETPKATETPKAQATETSKARPAVQPFSQDTFQGAKAPQSAAAAASGGGAQATGGEKGAVESVADFIGRFFGGKPSQAGASTPSKPVEPRGRPQEAASGAEAAARLKNPGNYFGPEATRNRARDYVTTLEKHKDDPAFAKELYEGLGPEETQKLLSTVVPTLRQDNNNEYRTEADVEKALDAVASSLYQTPAEFQQQVGRGLVEKGDTQSSLLLGRSDAPDALKRAYVDAAVDKAAGQGSNSDDFARAVGNVLASDPALVREYVPRLSQEGKLTGIFKNGLSLPPLTDSFHPDSASLRPDGLERLVGQVGQTLQGPEYADVRAQVFRDASTVLEGTKTGDPLRTSLVRNLETLFHADPEGILDRLTNNSSAGNGKAGAYDPTKQALGAFLREAAFAKPDANDPFGQDLQQLTASLRQKSLDPSLGRTANEQSARLLGHLVGSLATGYSSAIKDSKATQAQRDALAKAVVGLLAKPGEKFVPFGGDQLKDAAEKILGKFYNADLEGNRKNANALLQQLVNGATVDFENYDRQNGTNLLSNFNGTAAFDTVFAQLFGDT